MMYHGYGMGAGWSLIVFAIVLPALLLAVGLLVGQFRNGPGAARPPESDAEGLLAERLARGEIDAEEFEQRLRALRAARR
jgi:putative membrane protein